jgi:hypothetical protein
MGKYFAVLSIWDSEKLKNTDPDAFLPPPTLLPNMQFFTAAVMKNTISAAFTNK